MTTAMRIFYAGIDVTLTSVVGKCGLGAGSDGGELVLDGGDDLLHVVLPHIFLYFVVLSCHISRSCRM